MTASVPQFSIRKAVLTKATFDAIYRAEKETCRNNVDCISSRFNAEKDGNAICGVYSPRSDYYSLVPDADDFTKTRLHISRADSPIQPMKVIEETSEAPLEISGVVERVFVADWENDGTEEMYVHVVNGGRPEYFKLERTPLWLDILGKTAIRKFESGVFSSSTQKVVVNFFLESAREGEESLRIEVEGKGSLTVTQNGGLYFAGSNNPEDLLSDALQALYDIEARAEESGDIGRDRAAESAEQFILGARNRFLKHNADWSPEIPFQGAYILKTGNTNVTFSPLPSSDHGQGVRVEIDPPGWRNTRSYIMNRAGELVREISFRYVRPDGGTIDNFLIINREISSADRALISAAILKGATQEKGDTPIRGWFEYLRERQSSAPS